MKKIYIPLLICLLLAGCDFQKISDIEVPEDAKPIQLRVDLQKRVNQDNEFAFNLLRNTIAVSHETNVFISPLSVSIALGMAWNGANGETKSQMESALNMNGLSVDDINEYYRVMQSSLPGIDPTTKLNIANSLWYRTGFPIKESFIKINTDNFSAYVRELDFGQAWAVDTINNWCAKHTNNLIPQMLQEISPEAVAFIVNAVYFKGIWRKKFDKKNTLEADFTTESAGVAKVNMMYQKDTFAYAADGAAQYLDMPYGNKAFSMTVILPNEGVTTNEILAGMTADSWKVTLNNMQTKEVEVYFPRFKNKCEFTLNDELKNMGMKLAFTGSADFSNMTDERVFISFVKHNACVEVTEEGTEAAAVTIIGFENTSMPPATPVFKVNKPFIFVIREKSTGVILFVGKMGSIDKY